VNHTSAAVFAERLLFAIRPENPEELRVRERPALLSS
jgi:hypothetical protein